MDLIAVSVNGFCVYLGTTLGQAVYFCKDRGFDTSVPTLSRHLKEGAYTSSISMDGKFEVLTITRLRFDSVDRQAKIVSI